MNLHNELHSMAQASDLAPVDDRRRIAGESITARVDAGTRRPDAPTISRGDLRRSSCCSASCCTCSFRRSITDRRASSRWHSHNYLVAADTTRHDVAQFFFDLGVYSDVRKKLLEQGMLPAVLHLAKGSAILQRSLARILDRFSEDDDCKAPR